MDKQALLNASLPEGAAGSVEALSDNRFRVGNNEYQVWTEEEAQGFGYMGGWTPTSDPMYKVYRIF